MLGNLGSVFGRISGLNLVRLIGLAVLVFLVLFRINEPGFMRDFRFQSFDYFQQLKPREATPVPVTIIDIDEKSLREVGQWPWPRTKIAEMIDRLTQMGAAVIGFDVIFAERDRLSPGEIARENTTLPTEILEALKALPSNEEAMAAAIQRSRVVLGQSSVRELRDNSGIERELKDAPHAKLGEDPMPFLQVNALPELIENVPEIEAVATGRGVFSYSPDPDGIIRRVPLVLLVSGKIRAALSLESLRIATGGKSFVIRTNEAGIEGIVVAGQLVKTDANARVWPYFRPPDSSRYVSIADILSGKADPAKIAGHIILLGTSATGLEDYRSIPLGVPTPGVEVHAQVIENIMTNSLLTRDPFTFLYEVIAVVLAGLFIIFIGYRFGAAGGIIIALVLIAAAVWAAWYQFDANRLLYDATWPAFSVFALSATGIIGNYIREEQQRAQVQGAFGQYLSPAMVEQLADDPDKLKLGGETRELSVLFSDVRGFTALSESYREDPGGLTRLMNRFLTVLSQPILDQNGTIDKYMGDAIMAFWNAPIDEPEHARKSCLAALAMIEDVESLNIQRKSEMPEDSDQEFLPINVGVGINTGICVVGNMGSDKRFDYTALGDTVNLASRLEGQSKPYGLPIVIGNATAEQVEDTMATFQIDLIRVKGKNEPVKVHCLAGDETFAEKDEFKAFRAINKTMIAAYHNREWDTAYEALEKVEELGEKLGITVEEYIFIYETRISEFRANPPGRDWDGVYTATSK